jgi:hypothetical protein
MPLDAPVIRMRNPLNSRLIAHIPSITWNPQTGKFPKFTRNETK